MNLQALFTRVRVHLPYLIGVALVILNALIANGDLQLNPHTLDVLNALLAAFGLGVLHNRQQQ